MLRRNAEDYVVGAEILAASLAATGGQCCTVTSDTTLVIDISPEEPKDSSIFDFRVAAVAVACCFLKCET